MQQQGPSFSPDCSPYCCLAVRADCTHSFWQIHCQPLDITTHKALLGLFEMSAKCVPARLKLQVVPMQGGALLCPPQLVRLSRVPSTSG